MNEAWEKLTPRHQECIRVLVERGGSTKEAARELGVSRFTVRRWRSDIYQRLGASGLVDALNILGMVRKPPR